MFVLKFSSFLHLELLRSPLDHILHFRRDFQGGQVELIVRIRIPSLAIPAADGGSDEGYAGGVKSLDGRCQKFFRFRFIAGTQQRIAYKDEGLLAMIAEI